MALTRKDFARHSRPVLKTRRWQVLRLLILERDGWKCRCCGDRRRLEVDHIRPVRSRPGLSFDAANLQTLCASCHTKKSRIECGHKPVDPTRQAWRNAVSELSGSDQRGIIHKETTDA